MSGDDGARALPIPLVIVAGFLGAGKTTLMNQILSADHGRRVGVIVNDFGSINIDAELVTDLGEGMVSLANGCICCAIRSDLIAAVLRLAALPDPPEHILIESSGVADPDSIFRSFLQPQIRDQVLVDGVLTVVDAELCSKLSDKDAELAAAQVAAADLVILNKVDLVEADGLAEAETWIARLTSRAPVLRARNCDLPVEVLLGSRLGGLRPATAMGSDAEHSHDQDFETWIYQSAVPLQLARLQAVLNKLPRQLLRAKGFVLADDHRERRLLLQLVGRRALLSEDRPWGDGPKETRLVFIARRGYCNIPAIDAALRACGHEG